MLEHVRAPRDLAAGLERSARAVLPSTCPLAAGGWHITSSRPPPPPRPPLLSPHPGMG